MADPAGPQPLGILYLWQRGDPLPDLPPLAGLRAEPTDDARLVAQLADLPPAEVRTRRSSGHQPYLAWQGETPVAYGWSARRQLEIGELRLTRQLPAGSHYLWDFKTLAAWRGQGVYPRLLQAILGAEMKVAERFWIGHDADNVASGRGIRAAGFVPVAQGFGQPDGTAMLRPAPGGALEHARAAANLIGMTLDV